MNFTWAGRRLTKTEIGSDTISYTYNIDGIRTSKTVGTETTEYFLEGSTVIAQKTGNNVLWFLYDADGQRIGFTYNDTPYLYVYNATGDVVGIVDDTLTMVVEYTYSPWGEILSTTGDEANTIGVINPFRYRGYYYDEETGLYYLNARYYDPETGRFISADISVSTGQGFVGNNMFAYCVNNPVNYYDPTGEFAVAAVLGGAAAILPYMLTMMVVAVSAYLIISWIVDNFTFPSISWDSIFMAESEAEDESGDTPVENDENLDEDLETGNFNKVNDNYLKRKGIDAHEVKKDVLGRKAPISKYDIYVNKDTGELYVFKKGGKGKGIPTGEFIK